MTDNVDADLLAALKGLIGPVLGVVAGMAWGLADDVKAGRPLTRRMLAANIMTAGGLGLVVGGLSEWLSLPILPVMAMGAIFGKLGTDWLILVLLPRLVDRWLPRQPEPPQE